MSYLFLPIRRGFLDFCYVFGAWVQWAIHMFRILKYEFKLHRHKYNFYLNTKGNISS